MVCFVGNISKLKRRKVVDETGIHYPIKEMTVAVEDGFGLDMMTAFYSVRLTDDQTKYLKAMKAHKGSVISITGKTRIERYQTKEYVHYRLWLENANFTVVKAIPKRKEKKSA